MKERRNEANDASLKGFIPRDGILVYKGILSIILIYLLNKQAVVVNV